MANCLLLSQYQDMKPPKKMPTMSRLEPYMIGTSSIPYVYQKEFEARTAHRRATCTCSAGGPNDRTVSCSLHNKSAGFSKQRTAPAPHEESGGLGFRLDAVETAANEAIAFEAIALVNTGMYEEALPALTQWISQEPSNTEALAQRSLCYGALRWYPRGLVMLGQCVVSSQPTLTVGFVLPTFITGCASMTKPARPT